MMYIKMEIEEENEVIEDVVAQMIVLYHKLDMPIISKFKGFKLFFGRNTLGSTLIENFNKYIKK